MLDNNPRYPSPSPVPSLTLLSPSSANHPPAATMAMSGVKLTEECQKTYQSIQKDKSHRYAIFKIADGQICLDKVRWGQGEGGCSKGREGLFYGI